MSITAVKKYEIVNKLRALNGKFKQETNDLFFIEDFELAGEVAFIVHAFYPDIAFRLFDRIAETQIGYDIFITCPRNMPEYFYFNVFLRFPYAKILHVDNKGRDILPWFKLNEVVDFTKYTAICKLHTKKTSHSLECGEYGLKTAIDGLIKDSSVIASNIQTVRDKKCMLASSNAIAVISKNSKKEKFTIFVNRLFFIVRDLHKNNILNIKKLVPGINLSKLKFVAGTMFWYHPNTVKDILALDINDDMFENEPLSEDGNLPHAIERLFGWSAKNIVEV